MLAAHLVVAPGTLGYPPSSLVAIPTYLCLCMRLTMIMEDILLSKNNTKCGGNVLYWYCFDLPLVLTPLSARTHMHTRTNTYNI